jgi:NAD(P)-dependent dehydrogenase (short-subunit alcohol dehydrogenase family)
VRPGLLEGKVGVIAGVGVGLGRDVALAFAREGADVVLAARSDTVTSSVAREVEELGRSAHVVKVDLRSAEGSEHLAAEAVRRFGRIDSLTMVAYVSADRTTLTEAEPDLSNWRDPFDVNVFATLATVRAVVPQMERQRHGRIILVNTTALQFPAERLAPYIGSKAALQAIARVLAIELGPLGIRVNSVHPGYIWGPRVEQILRRRAADRGTTFDDEVAAVKDGIALGYIPDSAQHAGPIVFLASELSAAITGESIYVNAGQSRH